MSCKKTIQHSLIHNGGREIVVPAPGYGYKTVSLFHVRYQLHGIGKWYHFILQAMKDDDGCGNVF